MTKLRLSRNYCWIVLGCVMFCTIPNCPGREKRSQRVIYLGDSQSMGAFGTTFDRSMRNRGLEVFTVVAGGSSPYYWLKTYRSIPSSIGYWEKTPDGERRLGYIRAVPKLEALMLRHQPDVVVVQTGINLYATLRSRRHSKDENRQEIKSLIDKMCLAISKAGARSYWILPPHSHEKKYPASLQDELRNIIRESVIRHQGSVFESQKFTHFTDPYPATDGIHFGREDSILWAEKVGAQFANYMKVSRSVGKPKIAKGLPLQTATTSHSTPASPLRAAPVPMGGEKRGDPVAGQVNNESVDLVLRLVEKSEIKHPNQVEYANALGLFEYEVIEDRKGNYKFDRIRVAHGIMFQRKVTGSARRKIGDTIDLVLVPLAKYPNLLRWPMADQLRTNLALPTYTPKLD